MASGLFAACGSGVTLLINNSIGSIVGFIIYWFVIENIIATSLQALGQDRLLVTKTTPSTSSAPPIHSGVLSLLLRMIQAKITPNTGVK